MADTPPRQDPFSADAGTDEQFAHWDSAQQQQEARRAINTPGGRAAHLSCRWTQPRGDGLPAYGSANRMGVADLLEILYAVILNETPGLAPDRDSLTSVAQLCNLGAIDTALYDVDRAARLLAGNAFGDSRHSQGTDTRIAAWLDATTDDDSDAARAQRDRWQRLHGPIRDSAGDEHVILPWFSVRRDLDTVLMVTTGGIRPGTRVHVTSGPHKGRQSTIHAAWWEADGPPTGYLLQGDCVPYTEPFPPDQLEPIEATTPSAD